MSGRAPAARPRAPSARNSNASPAAPVRSVVERQTECEQRVDQAPLGDFEAVPGLLVPGHDRSGMTRRQPAGYAQRAVIVRVDGPVADLRVAIVPAEAIGASGGRRQRRRPRRPPPAGSSEPTSIEIRQERQHVAAADAARVLEEHEVAAVIAVKDLHGLRSTKMSASELRHKRLASRRGRTGSIWAVSIHVALTHRHPLPLRSAGQAVAAARAPASGAALPHADPVLRDARRADRPLRPLAAGPAEQLRCPPDLPRTRARAADQVDLVAEMAVYNPFDFFLEDAAGTVCRSPTPTGSCVELQPYLRREPLTPRFADISQSIPPAGGKRTIDFLVDLNQRLHDDIGYVIRLDPGVQTAGRDARARPRVVPRLDVAAGAASAPSRAGGPVRVRLSDSARGRRRPPSTVRAARQPTSPICMRGARSICPAPAGSASIRRRVCSPARDTFRSRARPSRPAPRR